MPLSLPAEGGRPRVVAAAFSLRPEIALHHTIGTVDQEADAFHAGQ